MRLLVAVVAILLLGVVARLVELILTVNRGVGGILARAGFGARSFAGPGFFAFVIGGIAFAVLLFVIAVAATSVRRGG